MLITKFTDYLQHEKKYAINTINAYRKDLESFRLFVIEEFDVDDLSIINFEQIRNWIVFLSKKSLTNRSINRKLSSLNGFFKFLIKIKSIEKNPLQNHTSLKVVKKVNLPYTKKEFEKLKTLFKDDSSFSLKRDKIMILLFYYTGMRRNELINLQISDIDFSNNYIRILGKRDKVRLVPLISELKEELKYYMHLRSNLNPTNEYLIINDDKLKINETFVYRKINYYFSAISTKEKNSPHMIRHSFATHLLEEGIDINSLKELLGHASIASTQIYVNQSLEKIKNTYQKNHPRNIN